MGTERVLGIGAIRRVQERVDERVPGHRRVMAAPLGGPEIPPHAVPA